MEDLDLLELFRETSEPKYLGALYDRYIHLVYGLCLKYLKSREDSQDAVMGIYEKVSDVLISTEVAHFKSWLYVVAKNYCLMELRRRNGQEEKNNVLRMEFASETHLNNEALDTDLEALQMCLAQLRDEQKLCVTLFYLQKNSYQEVATQSGLPLKTVKSAIQNGKRNLKICIESQRTEQES